MTDLPTPLTPSHWGLQEFPPWDNNNRKPLILSDHGMTALTPSAQMRQQLCVFYGCVLGVVSWLRLSQAFKRIREISKACRSRPVIEVERRCWTLRHPIVGASLGWNRESTNRTGRSQCVAQMEGDLGFLLVWWSIHLTLLSPLFFSLRAKLKVLHMES